MLPVSRLSSGYEAALTGIHISSFTELCRVSLAEDSVSVAPFGIRNLVFNEKISPSERDQSDVKGGSETNANPAFIPCEPPRIDAVLLACPCRT